MICRWQTFCRSARWFRLFPSREERKKRVWQLYDQMFITKNVQGYKKRERLTYINRTGRLILFVCSQVVVLLLTQTSKGNCFLLSRAQEEENEQLYTTRKRILTTTVTYPSSIPTRKEAQKNQHYVSLFFVMSTHQQTVVIDVLSSFLFVEDCFCSIKKEERHKLSTHK